jgi:hypothetical protein
MTLVKGLEFYFPIIYFLSKDHELTYFSMIVPKH